MSTLAVRHSLNGLFRCVLHLAAVVAAVPLLLVVAFVVQRGLPELLDLNFYTQIERPAGVPGGGLLNAIVGTLLVIALASAMALPVGVMAGICLSEFARGSFGDIVRFVSDVLTSVPSIVLGIFGYALLVATTGEFSALAGSVGLAALMIPTILRTTDSALSLVPVRLREAGWALGVAPWRVTLRITIPAALAGIVTGALLAVARAAGETAPLLFTALGSPYLNLNISRPTETLSLIVYRNALLPYPDLQDRAWGAALFLMLAVLVTGLAARVVIVRLQTAR